MAPESAAARRMVPIEVAELAREVQRIDGDHRLLESTVNQSLQVLTTAVNNIEAQQESAREDRVKQLTLLQSLNDRAQTIAPSAERVQELQLQVAHWRGVVVGFGVLATLVVGGAVAWVNGQFNAAATARTTLEHRIERLEQKP